jgi:uncharacterized glyoxalase superfamily protein PhnB
MAANFSRPGSTIVPTLRYRDVPAAIEWLCNAFGFKVYRVLNGGDGTIRYAELTFGHGMIMLAAVGDTAFDKLMTQPADTGGAETQICYLFVVDATAHCAQAKAAGAKILLDVADPDSNGRGYSCRDLEGHVWNFGTYDPQKRRSTKACGAVPRSAARRALRLTGRAVALTVVALACAMVMPSEPEIIGLNRFELAADAPTSANEEDASLLRERDVRIAEERALEATKKQLVQEREARVAAESLEHNIREQLNKVRAAREVAERAATDERNVEAERQQLVRKRNAVEAEQRAAQETLLRISIVERSTDAVREHLAAERSAREEAERSAQEAQWAREKLAQESKAKKRK